EVHDWVFLNLAQTDGAAVVISVGTFVQRIQRMDSEAGLGRQGAEARALLTARGLTPSTLQVAIDMLEQLVTAAPAHPAPNVDPAQHAAAEAAVWNWYLEWGEIARVAITDRKLLRELGFLNYKR